MKSTPPLIFVSKILTFLEHGFPYAILLPPDEATHQLWMQHIALIGLLRKSSDMEADMSQRMRFKNVRSLIEAAAWRCCASEMKARLSCDAAFPNWLRHH